MQPLLIYPQKNVAAMIAGRLAKSKKIEYGVTKVATGFLVEPIAKPAMHAVTSFIVQAAAAEAALAHAGMQVVDSLAKLAEADQFQITMPCKSISPGWIHARHDGKPFWIAKSSLQSFSAGDVHGVYSVTMTMPTAYAKKRGLLAK